MNYTILCKPRRDARVVEWAGLEIRSLSQDRGFESLSLLWNEKRSRKASLFVSSERMVDENPRRGFDWPRESEANTARSRITASGRNPKGKTWNEVNVLSNPTLSPREMVKGLAKWNELVVQSLTPWSEWECSRIEREREGTESDRTIQSLSLL